MNTGTKNVNGFNLVLWETRTNERTLQNYEKLVCKMLSHFLTMQKSIVDRKIIG